MKHFTTENILAYIADRLSQEEVFRIEAHLTECEECARRIDDYMVIREHFDKIWDSWTGKRHAQEVFKLHLLEAVTRSAIPAGLRERAIDTVQNIFEKTRVVLGIIKDTSGKAASLLQEKLEKIFPSETTLLFSPVPQPTRITGDGEEFPNVWETEGDPKYNAQYYPSSKKLTVTVKESAVDKPWPKVMPIFIGEGRVVMGEFEHPEDTDLLLVEFDDVPYSPDYIIFV
ncbi:hypothetical protein ES703_111591 [subsurface metagenome]